MPLKSWKEIPPGGLIPTAGNSRENKTGSWSSKKPTVDKSKCTGCRLCVSACPESAIKISRAKAAIDKNYCKNCQICTKICPKKAIN